MKKLQQKLKLKFGDRVSLTTNQFDKEVISVCALPWVSMEDFAFIKKVTKGLFVNCAVKPANNSVYIEIVQDND